MLNLSFVKTISDKNGISFIAVSGGGCTIFGDLSELAGPILIQILQPKKIVVSLLNLSYKDGNFFFSQWRKFYNFLETCLN